MQVGPDCTWVKSRIFTPSSALPAAPHGFADGRGRPLLAAAFAAFFGLSLTTFLADFFAAALTRDFTFLLLAICRPLYFLRSTLCGLRLPMRPLSLPAPGSITALISVGLPESMAAFTARLSSSGEVALTPVPPNASIILS